MSFVHLHLHSEYSLLDGACRLKDLVRSVKEKGQTAVAVTDHGNMYAAIEFYLEAKSQGIKPIIGVEAYVAQRTRFDKTAELDSKPYHLILLCKNMTGYRNLTKIISAAWTEGFYRKPRIDDELLEKYHDGLICLSACLAGEIPRLITSGDIDGAYEKARYYRDLFGEGNFYLELQDHSIRDQQQVNAALIRMSRDLNIPLAATNDCHYIDRSDAATHDILLCIQTGHTVTDPDRMRFETNEFYIKTEEEMRALFPNIPEAVENTQRIADLCNIEFEFGKTILPHFEVPGDEDHFTYFRRRCYEGLYRHYGASPDKSLTDRLEYELGVVDQMGYVDYYLIVNDFIEYARSQGIPVGPGRGSGAGSLAAYCIGITNVDPIRYSLIFERFLNPERVSMPDFDVDFCKRRRQEVIEYVNRKYGRDHVAQIVAFGTMAARGAVRDVGRALDVPLALVDRVAKQIPASPGTTISSALSISAELKEMYENNSEVRNLLDIARKVEGMPRNTTTHAAGVVITRDPVDTYVPLAKNDDTVVTQYTMTRLEQLGLLKMDFLGLRNLTVLNDARLMIEKIDPDFSEDNIDYSDRDVFSMIAKGHTDGVFQFESAGMRSTIMQLRPESIEDLIAVISLYRPGPMDSIGTYIENRHHPERITYKHPLLEPILNVTYGCIVYQEQVMQIFRALAGYSFGRADIVRRAMSKKKKDVMMKEREIFINGLVNDDGTIEVEGCLRRGVSEKIANEIFGEMESFASYAFNKSHAAAYATVSYLTAWYKYHYPKQYMAALMTSLIDDHSNLAPYIEECKRLGIRVLPPHVNYSDLGFTVSSDSIFFGLSAIKSLGTLLANAIVDERRRGGEYKNFASFCTRLAGKRLNSQGVDSLIKAGALDDLGANRRQLLMSAKNIIDSAEAEHKRNGEGQLSLFGDEELQSESNYVIPYMPEFSPSELLSLEKDVMGLYLSGHPLNQYSDYIKAVDPDRISDIIAEPQRFEGKLLHLVVLINTVRSRTTKKNTLMAFAQIEDLTGSIEMIVFPKTFADFGRELREGAAADVFARLGDNEEEIKLICDRVRPAGSVKSGESASDRRRYTENVSQPGEYRPDMRLFIKLPSESSRECDYAKKLLAVFDGRSPVSLYYTDEKRYEHLPQSAAVDLNDVMINELRRILGDSAVVVK